MDFMGPERRTNSDSRRSGIERRETMLSDVDLERRTGAGDRRQLIGKRSTDSIPLEMLERIR